MPTEPNPSMDEQLKAYAQTRRRQAGEPFTLPPGTRQVLRAEVDRQFGQPAAAHRPPLGWWERFWPYVALGSSTAILLAVCAAIWWQDRRPPEPKLASAKTADRLFNTNANAYGIVAQGTGATSPSAVRGQSTALELTGVTKDSVAPGLSRPEARLTERLAKTAFPAIKSLAGAAPQETAAAPPTQALPALPAASKGAVVSAIVPAAQPPTAAAPAAPPSTTEQATATGAMLARFAPTAPLSQRYVQQTASRQLRRNLNSPPTPQVLNDFRLEQSGNRLRITDADGSVYVGAIESADTFGLAAPGGQETFQEGQATRERQTAAGKPMAESERNAGAQGGYRFNATGTNRSLGQKVVVAGRLVATNAQEMMSQTMQNVAAGANFAAAASNVQQQSLQQLLFNNFKVQGRVTIGGRTQLEFNAVPAGQ